jgi:hypothetical protein
VFVEGSGIQGFHQKFGPAATPPNAVPKTTASASVTAASVPPRVPDSPTPKAPTPASVIQGEVESFIKSFYREMEQDDLGKALAHFDETVEYYTYGSRDKAFISDELQQYFASFPIPHSRLVRSSSNRRLRSAVYR